jgi:UDP-2,3-diacylglucosamine hydrolase
LSPGIPTPETAESGALFIADLHLDPRHPNDIDRFIRLTQGPARRTRGLYVLGDLFELWIGDDAVDPALTPVLDALRDLQSAGTQVSILRGNRDFLLGPAFAERTGCRLREEPLAIELGGQTALLCHGDALCTGDTDYQTFRDRVRDPAWQREFLSRPVDERRRLAQAARNMSRDATLGKPESIMDVNPDAVKRLMLKHAATVLIHGHTHRPGIHTLDLGGTQARRIVLGDWPERANVLVGDDDGGMSIEPVDALIQDI